MQLKSLTGLLALLQDAPPADAGSSNTIRIVAGVLALLLVAIIIMRRKRTSKKETEDEF